MITEPKEPFDPEVIAVMMTFPEFSQKSEAELIYLIKTGLDILHHHDQIRKGNKVKWAHYHLPLNHDIATKAALLYRNLDESKETR